VRVDPSAGEAEPAGDLRGGEGFAGLFAEQLDYSTGHGFDEGSVR